MGPGAAGYDLFQAWSLWAEGRLKATDILFYIPVFWWSRIGVIADFLASFILLINVQGFSRWVSEWEAFLRAKPTDILGGGLPRKPFGSMFVYGLLTLGPSMSFIAFAGVRELTTGQPFFPGLETWMSNSCGSGRICSDLLPFVIFMLYMGSGMIFGHFALLRFVVWLAKQPELLAPLRLLAVFLLVFGFHFLLLGT